MKEEHMKRLTARVNSLLDGASELAIYITPLKLQKLLYLNYGEYVIQGGNKLEFMNFEAWHYGPVISKVYWYYKHFGADVITEKMNFKKNYPSLIDDDTIDITIQEYAGLPEFKLVDITHNVDGAWYKAYKKGIGTPLAFEDIKNEFRR